MDVRTSSESDFRMKIEGQNDNNEPNWAILTTI